MNGVYYGWTKIKLQQTKNTHLSETHNNLRSRTMKTYSKEQTKIATENNFLKTWCQMSKIQHIPNDNIKHMVKIESTIIDRNEQKQTVHEKNKT